MSAPIVIHPDRLHEPEQRALADEIVQLVTALDRAAGGAGETRTAATVAADLHRLHRTLADLASELESLGKDPK